MKNIFLTIFALHIFCHSFSANIAVPWSDSSFFKGLIAERNEKVKKYRINKFIRITVAGAKGYSGKLYRVSKDSIYLKLKYGKGIRSFSIPDLSSVRKGSHWENVWLGHTILVVLFLISAIYFKARKGSLYVFLSLIFPILSLYMFYAPLAVLLAISFAAKTSVKKGWVFTAAQ